MDNRSPTPRGIRALALAAYRACAEGSSSNKGGVYSPTAGGYEINHFRIIGWPHCASASWPRDDRRSDLSTAGISRQIDEVTLWVIE